MKVALSLVAIVQLLPALVFAAPATKSAEPLPACYTDGQLLNLHYTYPTIIQPPGNNTLTSGTFNIMSCDSTMTANISTKEFGLLQVIEDYCINSPLTPLFLHDPANRSLCI